jgi:transcriptional regulator with XRE-family HTH domain
VSGPQLGAWLRERRLARGWGKAEMARRLHTAISARSGTAPSVKSLTRSLGDWEGGGRYPRDRWRAVICEVLGVTFEDFPHPPVSSAPSAVTTALDTDDPRPWMGVARSLLERIGTGELRPGDRIPRAADVGRVAGVSVPTTRLAYAYLEGRGVIRYWSGAGYHVSGGPSDSARSAHVPGKAVIGEGLDLSQGSVLAGAR